MIFNEFTCFSLRIIYRTLCPAGVKLKCACCGEQTHHGHKRGWGHVVNNVVNVGVFIRLGSSGTLGTLLTVHWCCHTVKNKLVTFTTLIEKLCFGLLDQIVFIYFHCKCLLLILKAWLLVGHRHEKQPSCLFWTLKKLVLWCKNKGKVWKTLRNEYFG